MTAPVLVQATDTEHGCTVCRSQKTVTLHPQHGRRCSDHATLPAGPYDRGLAADMVELGRPDAAFTYLAAHLRREIDLRFLRARIVLALACETLEPVPPPLGQCPRGPHRGPQGPNEDLSQCGTCWSISYAMRPEGEEYGGHLADCSLPRRHASYCKSGGDGHPPAATVRGYWPEDPS